MNAIDEQAMLASLLGFIPLVILVFWISVRVFRKAGRSGWWSVLLLVPVVNIVMVWIFAFMRWPALENAKAHQTTELVT